MKQQVYVCCDGETLIPMSSPLLIGMGNPASCPMYCREHIGGGSYKMSMKVVSVDKMQTEPFKIGSDLKVTKAEYSF